MPPRDNMAISDYYEKKKLLLSMERNWCHIQSKNEALVITTAPFVNRCHPSVREHCLDKPFDFLQLVTREVSHYTTNIAVPDYGHTIAQHVDNA